MRRRMMVLAALLCWLPPTAAWAQQPVDLGGGAVLAPSPSPFAQGNMVIALRTDTGSPNVQIHATVIGRCASGTFDTTVPVAADGTFTAFGSVRQAATRMRYELRGGLRAGAAGGTATARFERAVANRTRSCSARDVRWQARRAAAAFGERALVAPGATLYGLSDQARPRGVVLRVSDDGRTLRRALYGTTLRCTGNYASPAFDLPHDNLAILSDGRVSDREDGTRRTATSILKYTERFAATIGSDGAMGMFSVELTVRDRDTGKRITRCRSGIVRWSAAY